MPVFGNVLVVLRVYSIALGCIWLCSWCLRLFPTVPGFFRLSLEFIDVPLLSPGSSWVSPALVAKFIVPFRVSGSPQVFPGAPGCRQSGFAGATRCGSQGVTRDCLVLLGDSSSPRVSMFAFGFSLASLGFC
jgi:hypothetical protein